MNSFIENVNYLAGLDNNYGDGVVLSKSNLSLRNVANDVTLKFSYFNYNTRQIEAVTKGIQGMLYTGLETALQEFVTQIEATLGGNKFDASYTISSSNTGFLIHSFSITINSLDTKLKATEINFNAKITSTQVEIYNLYGNVTNPLKLLPTLALLDADTINDMDIIVENISSVNTVSDNIDDVVIVGNDITNVNTVANNTNNINTVSNDILNVNTVSTNIVGVNTVSENIDNVNNVSSISDDVVIASSISADISSVANIDDNVIIVADNISSVNTNANNIADINSVATTVVPNINEILLVDDRAAQVALDTIAVENDRAEVALMKLAVENIYDAFDDRFLGTKTSDPILDNDGNALLDGALYFNTSSNTLMVYDAVSLVWIMIPQLYLSTLLDVELTSITTGDILNWNGTNWVNTRTPKVDSIQLNGGASTEGIISWNADEGTADLTLPGGSTLQIGQENTRTIRNATASTIPNGRLCMFDGTIGNSGRIKVKPFTAGFNEAMYLYGVATQTIPSGSDGIITIDGKVRGIDTTGASAGEVWADEDILYAKPNDSGMMTNVMPADNELKLVVATVIHAHATNGCLEIRFMPFNENMYYTKVQNDILLNNKVDKNANIVASTGTKVTYDSKGLVTSSTILSADDIPNLDASKITTGTLSLDTTGSAAKLTTARSISITGDITWSTSFDGSIDVTSIGTLASVGDTGTGSFKKISTDTKGRVIGTQVVVETDITGLLSDGSITNTMLENSAVANLSGTNTGDQTITLTGDVTGSGTGSFGTILSNSGVTAGTYKSVTVDSKGRVTNGTNPTTLSGYGITDAFTKTETNTQISTAVNGLVDAAPGTLDTLNELAAALGDDSNFATTTANNIAAKVTRVTSTDNAIVRFDGTTGDVQNSSVTIDDSGNIGSGTQSFNGFGGSGGFKNFLRNPNLNIWQYGNNFACGVGTTFTADGVVSQNGGGKVNVDRIEYDSYVNSLRATLATKSTFHNLCFPMEKLRNILGGRNISVGATITASVYCSCSVPTDVEFQFRESNSSDGGQNLGLTNITIDTTKQLYSFTYTLPAGTSAYDNLIFQLGIGGLPINGYIEIDYVQVELGSSPSPIEERPPMIDLAFCQRYCFNPKYGADVANQVVRGDAYGVDSVNGFINFKYPVSMRTTPSLYLSQGLSSLWLGYQKAIQITSLAQEIASCNESVFKYSVASGNTAFKHYHLYMPNASHQILFLSEL